MSFLYPLGLLGLIAVPVLIIIYIIKNKYTEQVVSATYLWTLSDRFLKRKNPINRITGIISLILQILAVVLISFAIAHPVFVLPASANDYCFILDGSGSMNVVQNGKTRLELGKESISASIRQSADGSAYTLLYVADTTDIIYEGIEDKDRALSLLADLQPAYAASDFVDALGVAQDYFTENPAVQTVVVTDKTFETVQNVTIVNVAASAQNYALTDVSYRITGGKLAVEGTAFSYESDVDITVELFIDGSETASAKQTVSLKKSEGGPFEFLSDATDFRSLRVAIAEQDALLLDNEIVLYNEKYDVSYKTLIVSEKPFFMLAALQSVGNTQTEVVSPDQYEESQTGGYGLYVFDSFTPAVMPKDGAVWFFDPVSSTENSGFSVQGAVSLSEPVALVYNSSSAGKVKNLLAGAIKDDIMLIKYAKCGLYRSFTTLLSYEGNPLVFAGANAYGNREVVFAFDLHDSDYPLSLDYIVLTNNLLNFTFPAVVENQTVYCGDMVEINVLANCNSIRIDTPLGNVAYPNTDSEVCEYEATEVGVYTVTLMIGNTARTVNFYACLPEEERFPAATEQSFVLQGEPSGEKRDGKYEDLIIVFIVLAVIFIADWMVYCYEQYQLR